MSTARTWRRGTLAAAVAGASVLAATAVAGATTGSASTSATTTAYTKCATANLRVWRPGTNDHAAGSAYWELELSNVSSTTCTLSGFPGVSAVDGNGHQLGSAAGRDHRFAPATVVLRPGTTAHALLRITDVGVFSTATCQPVTATGLRVYPPGTTKATFVPLRFRACSQQGTVYLFVRTVRARAGIPGYGQ